jgi:hypothetical protein
MNKKYDKKRQTAGKQWFNIQKRFQFRAPPVSSNNVGM